MSSPPKNVVPQQPQLGWSPPADPDKPVCPYRRNFTVDIKSHTPPAPFGGRDYDSGTRAFVPAQTLGNITQTELVMRNPPLKTADPPAPRTLKLTITEELAVADGRGAQVAVCTIAPKVAGQATFQAVAKIYDPLYYSFPDKDVPSAPCDVTRVADMDYSREAAAYEHLQLIGQAGLFAPRYFGSWTFTIPIQIGETTEQRSVRLVLIENLRGPSIRELCLTSRAATFDKAYRLEILARVLDGNSNLLLKGINQRDLASRNVVLVYPPDIQPAAQQQILPRVVLIDYNVSIVYEKARPEIVMLPPKPMKLYWKNTLVQFEGWIPAEWEATPRLCQEWLSNRFGGENMALEQSSSLKK